MQPVLRRSPCIFCVLRLAARFSTSPREAGRSNDSYSPPQYRPTAKLNLYDDVEHQPRRKRWGTGMPGGPLSAVELLANRQELSDIRAGRTTERTSGGPKGGGRNYSLIRRGGGKRTTDDKIRSHLTKMRKTIDTDKILGRLELGTVDLRAKFDDFAEKLEQKFHGDCKDDTLLSKLRDAMERKEVERMEMEIKMAFFAQIVMAGFTATELQQQGKVANLQYPQEWFPATRARSREFHLHVGPTNSGKTYQALKRLEEAESGLYAGPLRLLAHEVYMRLNARGQRCNLVTGDERKTADEDPDAPMMSCTVEMVPLNAKVDVAVIDEIQVIGSEDRGWAWTQAVLGVQAKEVHLCGEERAVPIVKEIVALCGEKLHIHRYDRLSPLKMMNRSLAGNINNLRKGDCVVCFSVMAIHGLRQLIEKTLKIKVAVIYGSLPPETRAQQARLFNDPNNEYDILVASDAVGMGLNLSIKRMIFQTSHKFYAGGFNSLQVHEVKQIAGRAGRYSTAENDMKKSAPESPTKLVEAEPPIVIEPFAAETSLLEIQPASLVAPPKTIGLVTTLEKFDLPVITKAMSSEPTPITSAGIFPPTYIIERFVRYFPQGTPFSFLLNRLHEIASTNSRFHLCSLTQQTMIANSIEEVEALTTTDRLIFCSSPADPRKPGEIDLLLAYAELVAGGQAACILDVAELNLDILSDDWSATRPYLKQVESLHKGVVLWMWLSFRFPAIFTERELAVHVKEMVEKRIEETLEKLSFDFQKYQKSREQMILDMLKHDGQSNESEETAEDDEATTALSEHERSVTQTSTRDGGRAEMRHPFGVEANIEEDAENASDRVPAETWGAGNVAMSSEEVLTKKPPSLPLAMKENREHGATASTSKEPRIESNH